MFSYQKHYATAKATYAELQTTKNAKISSARQSRELEAELVGNIQQLHQAALHDLEHFEGEFKEVIDEAKNGANDYDIIRVCIHLIFGKANTKAEETKQSQIKGVIAYFGRKGVKLGDGPRTVLYGLPQYKSFPSGWDTKKDGTPKRNGNSGVQKLYNDYLIDIGVKPSPEAVKEAVYEWMDKNDYSIELPHLNEEDDPRVFHVIYQALFNLIDKDIANDNNDGDGDGDGDDTPPPSNAHPNPTDIADVGEQDFIGVDEVDGDNSPSALNKLYDAINPAYDRSSVPVISRTSIDKKRTDLITFITKNECGFNVRSQLNANVVNGIVEVDVPTNSFKDIPVGTTFMLNREDKKFLRRLLKKYPNMELLNRANSVVLKGMTPNGLGLKLPKNIKNFIIIQDGFELHFPKNDKCLGLAKPDCIVTKLDIEFDFNGLLGFEYKAQCGVPRHIVFSNREVAYKIQAPQGQEDFQEGMDFIIAEFKKPVVTANGLKKVKLYEKHMVKAYSCFASHCGYSSNDIRNRKPIDKAVYIDAVSEFFVTLRMGNLKYTLPTCDKVRLHTTGWKHVA